MIEPGVHGGLTVGGGSTGPGTNGSLDGLVECKGEPREARLELAVGLGDLECV